MPAAERPRRSPRENWLGQTRERQGTEPQAGTELLDRCAADTKGPSNDFSFAYLGNKVASRLAMRGSPRFRSVVQPAAGTHWSEDTLGLPPKTLARCVFTPRDSKSVSGVNFPLPTYSVFGEKNVSRENENILVWPPRRCVLSSTQDAKRVLVTFVLSFTLRPFGELQGVNFAWFAAIQRSTNSKNSFASATISSASVFVAMEAWS